MGGVEIIRLIQSVHSPLLDQVFGLITNLNHEAVYLLVLPLIYWLYDKRFGRYLFAVLAIALWSNDLFKGIVVGSRPDPGQVRVLMPETTGGSPGFPSGHAQTSLLFWGAIAWQVRRTWVTVAVLLTVFLIGLSRLYLGLHWPLDVLGGWAIGAILLLLLQRSRPFWSGERQSLALKLILAVALPLVAVGLNRLLLPTAAYASVWLQVGAFAGLMAGSALEEAYVGFDPRRGSVWIQVAKCILGFFLLLAVKEGFKVVLPDTGMGDLVRYFLVTLSATLVAPWLFHHFLTPQATGTGFTRGG